MMRLNQYGRTSLDGNLRELAAVSMVRDARSVLCPWSHVFHGTALAHRSGTYSGDEADGADALDCTGFSLTFALGLGVYYPDPRSWQVGLPW